MSRCKCQLLAAVVGLEELPGLEGLGPSNIMHANQPVQQGTAITNPTQAIPVMTKVMKGHIARYYSTNKRRRNIPESITKTQLRHHFFEAPL